MNIFYMVSEDIEETDGSGNPVIALARSARPLWVMHPMNECRFLRDAEERKFSAIRVDGNIVGRAITMKWPTYNKGDGIMEITEQQLDCLGMLIDKVVSARTYSSTGMLPPELSIAAIDAILRETSGELRELYIEISGEDPWEDHPQEIQP